MEASDTNLSSGIDASLALAASSAVSNASDVPVIEDLEMQNALRAL
jgi:hypothetical protein